MMDNASALPHMPTATTTTEIGSRSKIGLKAPTRLHDELLNINAAPHDPEFDSDVIGREVVKNADVSAD
jgi:hypothetical protein